jgi:hypothetical protein
MHFSANQLLALAVGASFAAGLNVYAMLLTLGLLARADVVQLPPALHLVPSWGVIAAAGVMFVIEFFADKIPAFDLVWNALHTFIRVPIAALVAYAATAQLSPEMQVLSAALGAVLAATAHTGKTAVRAAVTPSPEPFSNIALSAGEDVAAVGLTWFATTHPYWAAAIAVLLTVVAFFLIRVIVRSLRKLFRRARGSLTPASAEQLPSH